jgi:hypothetical protein
VAAAVASAAAWRQREIGSGGSKAALRHGGGAAAARRHYQWRQRRRWGRMTKAAAVMVCGGEKKLFLRFLNFDVWRGGRLSGCLFVPAVFQEVRFYLNNLTYVRRGQYSCGVVLVFWFRREIVFGVTYVLSVQHSCAIVSVFLVVAGNCSLNENTFLQINLIGLLFMIL